MKKTTLILLIILIGAATLFSAGKVKAADPVSVKIEAPDEAQEGTEVKINATCENSSSAELSSVKLELYRLNYSLFPVDWSSTDSLGSSGSISCSYTSTMPSSSVDIKAVCRWTKSGISYEKETTKTVKLSGASVCNDTDGGNDKLVKGTCTDTGGSYTDTCIDNTTIQEYFCSEGGGCVGATDTSCPENRPFCVNGACVAEIKGGNLGECDSNNDCTSSYGEGYKCICDPSSGDGVREGKCVPEGSIAICNPLKANTFQDLINNIMNFIFWLAMALTPLMIIIGAFYFIFSGGSSEKIEKGKKIIIYTLIGFVIILLGKAIIGIIKSILGG